MEPTRLTQDLSGKAIIDMTEGRKIGTVEDIRLDPHNLNPTAIVVSSGGLLKRDMKIIPASEVKVWGEDVIIVSHPDVIQNLEHPAISQDESVSISNSVKGKYVVDLEGTRIGQIDDIAINSQGKMKYYHLSNVFVDGPYKESKKIPVEATHSLKDVLIVDTNKSFPTGEGVMEESLISDIVTDEDASIDAESGTVARGAQAFDSSQERTGY